MEQARSLIATFRPAAVRGNDNSIRETIENLRLASENLAQLSAGVKGRPWSLVRNPPTEGPQDSEATLICCCAALAR